jgi:hypothetical protein
MQATVYYPNALSADQRWSLRDICFRAESPRLEDFRYYTLWEGDVACETPEEALEVLFGNFNDAMAGTVRPDRPRIQVLFDPASPYPAEVKCRSMNPGDIIEVGGVCYICLCVGWAVVPKPVIETPNEFGY